MANRRLLRRQMREAWADTIQTAYTDRVISSERGLQVHFSSRLMALFQTGNVKRRLFVEPKMDLPDGKRVHPDLLICNQNSIIGVVELKYQPKKRPSYEKDFRTFELLAEQGSAIEIVNTRYRGVEYGRNRFSLNRDPMFVWAGVYKSPVQSIPLWEPQNFLANQLLVLHAATSEAAEPQLFVTSGNRHSAIAG